MPDNNKHRNIELIVASALAVITLGGIWVNLHNSNKILEQQFITDEIKERNLRLSQFYYPFRLSQRTSKEWFNDFKNNLDKEYSTLRSLLKNDTISASDSVLLDQIIVVGHQMERIVTEHGGVVQDRSVVELLPKLLTHLRMVRLAYEGTLSGAEFRFEDNGFPDELPKAIDAQILKLEKECDSLRLIIK